MSENLQLPPKIDSSENPRWLIENYPGMEQDIENWYTSYYFWRKWDGKVESLDSTKVQARAVAQARYKSLVQTNSIKIASEKSELLQLYRSKDWLHYIEEIEDVKELIEVALADAKEKDPTGSAAYDLEFILNKLIPTLEKLDVPKEAILCILPNMSKARYSVPSLRKIVSNDGPQMQDHIVEIMKSVADGNVTAREFRNTIIPKIMGEETPKTPLPAIANVCMLPDGREFVAIITDPAHVRAIKMTTKAIVSGFDYTDPAYLLKEVGNLVKPKSTSRKRYKADSFQVLQESSEKGVYLPSVNSFKDLAITEYLKHRFYIRKPGVQRLIIEEIGLTYNLETFATELGYNSTADAFEAMRKLYAPVLPEIHKELQDEDFVITDLKIDLLDIQKGKPTYYLFLELFFQLLDEEKEKE